MQDLVQKGREKISLPECSVMNEFLILKTTDHNNIKRTEAATGHHPIRCQPFQGTIELIKLNSTFKPDIRYASGNSIAFLSTT